MSVGKNLLVILTLLFVVSGCGSKRDVNTINTGDAGTSIVIQDPSNEYIEIIDQLYEDIGILGLEFIETLILVEEVEVIDVNIVIPPRWLEYVILDSAELDIMDQINSKLIAIREISDTALFLGFELTDSILAKNSEIQQIIEFITYRRNLNDMVIREADIAVVGVEFKHDDSVDPLFTTYSIDPKWDNVAEYSEAEFMQVNEILMSLNDFYSMSIVLSDTTQLLAGLLNEITEGRENAAKEVIEYFELRADVDFLLMIQIIQNVADLGIVFYYDQNGELVINADDKKTGLFTGTPTLTELQKDNLHTILGLLYAYIDLIDEKLDKFDMNQNIIDVLKEKKSGALAVIELILKRLEDCKHEEEKEHLVCEDVIEQMQNHEFYSHVLQAKAAEKDEYGLYNGGHALVLNGIGQMVFERKGLFIRTSENASELIGILKVKDDESKRFCLKVVFDNKHTGDEPKKELMPAAYSENGGPIVTDRWSYYDLISAKLTGMDDLKDLHIELEQRGSDFQVGKGANGKNINYGASGWNSYIIEGLENYQGIAWSNEGIGDINIDLKRLHDDNGGNNGNKDCRKSCLKHLRRIKNNIRHHGVAFYFSNDGSLVIRAVERLTGLNKAKEFNKLQKRNLHKITNLTKLFIKRIDRTIKGCLKNGKDDAFIRRLLSQRRAAVKVLKFVRYRLIEGIVVRLQKRVVNALKLDSNSIEMSSETLERYAHHLQGMNRKEQRYFLGILKIYQSILKRFLNIEPCSVRAGVLDRDDLRLQVGIIQRLLADYGHNPDVKDAVDRLLQGLDVAVVEQFTTNASFEEQMRVEIEDVAAHINEIGLEELK